MKTYKIITNCTAITEYTISANSEEEAKERFFEGEFETEKITDYQDETIESVILTT